MRALLDANLGTAGFFEEMFDMQATMFPPVGGMDRIAAAFEKRSCRACIRSNSTVEQIRKTSTGVSIGFRDTEKRCGTAAVTQTDVSAQQCRSRF